MSQLEKLNQTVKIKQHSAVAFTENKNAMLLNGA